MSSVIVLTPLVIGAWPMIASAVAGAAASMGFSLVGLEQAAAAERVAGREEVETEIANSEVLAESMARGQKATIVRDGVTVEFGVDARGRCRACVSGVGKSKAELKRIGDEVVGRVVQQFAYHKIVTELKERKFSVVGEKVEKDNSIRMTVRLNS